MKLSRVPDYTLIDVGLARPAPFLKIRQEDIIWDDNLYLYDRSLVFLLDINARVLTYRYPISTYSLYSDQILKIKKTPEIYFGKDSNGKIVALNILDVTFNYQKCHVSLDLKNLQLQKNNDT